MKVICPVCGAEVYVTKFGKIQPHKHLGARCGGSGKRVEVQNNDKEIHALNKNTKESVGD